MKKTGCFHPVYAIFRWGRRRPYRKSDRPDLHMDRWFPAKHLPPLLQTTVILYATIDKK